MLEDVLSEMALDPSAYAAGFDCTREGCAWRLKMWGPLAPTWAGNVSLHCHAARIGIVEGDAMRVRGRLWVGTFLLEAGQAAARPDGFDFLQMAQRRPPILPHRLAPEILELDVEREREAGPATVRIAGRDQLGFLASVLETIASCQLEPFRISLRTQDGVARDRFVLFGRGGTPAKGQAVQRLVRSLSRRCA